MASETIARLQIHTERLSRLCELIEVFEGSDRRKALIMCLWEGEFLSPGCAELLIEHYGLDHA